jgi:hypothetical protein
LTQPLKDYVKNALYKRVLKLVRNMYSLLVGKPEGMRSVGRPRRRWEDSMKMDLGEIEWGGVDWIGMTQDMEKCRTLVNAVVNIRVP